VKGNAERKAAKPAADPFALVRQHRTNGINYGVTTDDIIVRLTKWRSLCSFRVTDAKGDRIDIEFDTLPKKMDAFVRDLYEFCPDLVDQGTGCIHELVEMAEASGKDLGPDLNNLIKGIDFRDSDYGLEILKRELVQKALTLWWD